MGITTREPPKNLETSENLLPRRATSRSGASAGGPTSLPSWQKDRDARWIVKPADDGSPRIALAVPAFGYKDHVGIDRRHGLIRTWRVTDAAPHDGTAHPDLQGKHRQRCVGDTGYIHVQREAPGHARSTTARSRRSAHGAGERGQVEGYTVEHVFAHEKGPMVGLARARVKIGLGSLVYKHEVTIWLTGRHRRPKRPSTAVKRPTSPQRSRTNQPPTRHDRVLGGHLRKRLRNSA
jgi:IS5 family transposase